MALKWGIAITLSKNRILACMQSSHPEILHILFLIFPKRTQNDLYSRRYHQVLSPRIPICLESRIYGKHASLSGLAYPDLLRDTLHQFLAMTDDADQLTAVGQ